MANNSPTYAVAIPTLDTLSSRHQDIRPDAIVTQDRQTFACNASRGRHFKWNQRNLTVRSLFGCNNCSTRWAKMQQTQDHRDGRMERMETQMGKMERTVVIEAQRSRSYARQTTPQSAIAALMSASNGDYPQARKLVVS